jgi:hypothetical protein
MRPLPSCIYQALISVGLSPDVAPRILPAWDSHVAGQTSHARCTCDQPLILRALNLPLPGGEQPVWIGQCAHCHLIYVELRAEFYQTNYGGWKGPHAFRFSDLFRS